MKLSDLKYKKHKATLRHITNKLIKTSDKYKILKAAGGKKIVCTKKPRSGGTFKMAEE